MPRGHARPGTEPAPDPPGDKHLITRLEPGFVGLAGTAVTLLGIPPTGVLPATPEA